MSLGVIYKATNLKTGKIYIGQTIQPLKSRIMQHWNSKRKCHFHDSLHEYGLDNFKWEIVQECPESKLNQRQIYWISEFDSYYHGYNETRGGDNADGLLTWQKEHPEEVLKNAENGLRYAKEWCKTHRDEHLQQLASVRQKGVDKVKRQVQNIDLGITFDSLADAQRWSLSDLNPNHKKASHQHIAKVCSGLRHTCGGYKWKYVD